MPPATKFCVPGKKRTVVLIFNSDAVRGHAVRSLKILPEVTISIEEVSMHKHGEYLCSDLISLKFSTGETVMGHLEMISKSGCHITLDERVAAQSVVALQCVECPKGEAHCIRCRMTGVIISQDDDLALGVLAAVEFTNGTWCEERWKPRHLVDLDLLTKIPPARARASSKPLRSLHPGCV
jgi:hypothetical protein